MRDIVVTTPRNKMQDAAKEAALCLKNGGGYYFRKLSKVPKELSPGSRCFYVEDDYVRGFAVIANIADVPKDKPVQCIATGLTIDGYTIFMLADSWQWINPIHMRGFQGWRYFDAPHEVIGDWRFPKPPKGYRLYAYEDSTAETRKAWVPLDIASSDVEVYLDNNSDNDTVHVSDEYPAQWGPIPIVEVINE